MSQMGRARPAAQRVKCASNLRQIGFASILYANDHSGEFPTDSQVILDTQDILPVVFTCFHDHGDGPDGSQGEPLTFRMNLSYAYFGRGVTNTASGDKVIATEPLSNHSGEGANVLFADGHVDFVEAAKFETLLDTAVTDGRLAPELRDILLIAPD